MKELKKSASKEVIVSLDIFPDKKEDALFQELSTLLKKEPKKSIKNILKGFLPERYLLFLLKKNEIDPLIQAATLSNEKLRNFVESCKRFRFTVNGTLPIEKAFVTGGGVSIKEIEPKTMASKLMNGLYFCGEILDIHGYTGGFNITSALVTGRLAGLNAGQYSNLIHNG